MKPTAHFVKGYQVKRLKEGKLLVASRVYHVREAAEEFAKLMNKGLREPVATMHEVHGFEPPVLFTSNLSV